MCSCLYAPRMARGRRVRTSTQILLVRKYQQQGILHFSVLDDPREFRLGLLDTGAVV